jgi:hypothetical protein
VAVSACSSGVLDPTGITLQRTIHKIDAIPVTIHIARNIPRCSLIMDVTPQEIETLIRDRSPRLN